MTDSSFLTTNKYKIQITSEFKSNYKNKKQYKDISKLKTVLAKLTNKEELESKYKNHKLKNDKYYKDCYECHILPDWLLVYRYNEDKLILILVNTGSHSELF